MYEPQQREYLNHGKRSNVWEYAPQRSTPGHHRSCRACHQPERSRDWIQGPDGSRRRRRTDSRGAHRVHSR